jgi:hypothetical protein
MACLGSAHYWVKNGISGDLKHSHNYNGFVEINFCDTNHKNFAE